MATASVSGLASASGWVTETATGSGSVMATVWVSGLASASGWVMVTGSGSAKV
jgi:hypothetical protein